MSKLQTNAKVNTPVGEGVVQGGFTIRQLENELRAVLVRVPLSDAVREHLRETCCVTPHAEHSALFVFPEEQVQG